MAIQTPKIFNFFGDSGTLGDGTTDANVLTLWGTADANTTVKIYDGQVVLGTVSATSSGVWTFETPKLSNATHSFTVTATDAQGSTSAPSAAMPVTVVPSITHFVPTTDNWSDPSIIDGLQWYSENANNVWSLTSPDSHTVRMEVRAGDLWADDDTSRSEIQTSDIFQDGALYNVAYTMTVEPGTLNNP